MKISFVIPCYRSEKTVGGVIAEIISTVEKSDYDYEIICVNDCSPDDVWRVLKDLAGCNLQRAPSPKRFHHLAALENGQGENGH